MQDHDSRGSGQRSEGSAHCRNADAVEVSEDTHYEVGAVNLRTFFVRLLRDGVYFQFSILD